MSTIHKSILNTIGGTPVVKLDKLAPPGINLYVKVESFNPLGSVKDRLALGVIEHAERTGALKPGQTVIEATSGNTGLGLAMVCARKGYPLVIVMAENFSVERRRMLRFLGARVVLTPASAKGSGMLAKARELAEQHGWFLCRQFENEANAAIHSATTAQEILHDFEDTRLDYWVTGYGTGGTLKGVARELRKARPDIKIVACEPDNSALLSSGVSQPAKASHPAFRPHVMQGWTPDFISKLTADSVASHWVDEIVPVPGDESLRLARELARCEGIFAGISSGATLAGALKVCEGKPPGTSVLCMLPDTGERYLSTILFDDVDADMNAEEKAIASSTAGYRFDLPMPAAKSEPQPVGVPAAAAQFVHETVHSKDKPVVMFSLAWCEFCWSVRKLFDRSGIAYESVDLDSVAYQAKGWGGEVRSALTALTGVSTIPQIFVAGQFVGGATDVLKEFDNGRLQDRLNECGIAMAGQPGLNANSLLPSWIHPR